LAIAKRHASWLSLKSAGRTTEGSASRAGRELLDRLMRRAVLAEADRVVRVDEDRRDLHQRAEADAPRM
jgi:hypothetical protein